MRKTEKQLRAEYEAQGLSEANIDALVKAHKAAALLDDDDEDERDDEEDEDEDEGDEADELDDYGDAVAKARRLAAASLAKAEKIKTEVYMVTEPPADGSPEQRSAYERTPHWDSDVDIDEIDAAEVLKDIVKAAGNETLREIRAGLDAMFKAQTKQFNQLAERFEQRLKAQDAILDLLVENDGRLIKAARKSRERIDNIAKALDVTPVARRPKYTVEDVVIDGQRPLPLSSTSRLSAIDRHELEGWVLSEMDAVRKSGAIGGAERERLAALAKAIEDLDAGEPAEFIANAVGYKPAR
jgi:hypothetical protein